jgi:hypothetical protein
MQPGWMIALYGKRRKRRNKLCNSISACVFFTPVISIVRGTHTPRIAHNASWGRRISNVLGLQARAAAGFFCPVYRVPGSLCAGPLAGWRCDFLCPMVLVSFFFASAKFLRHLEFYVGQGDDG